MRRTSILPRHRSKVSMSILEMGGCNVAMGQPQLASAHDVEMHPYQAARCALAGRPSPILAIVHAISNCSVLFGHLYAHVRRGSSGDNLVQIDIRAVVGEFCRKEAIAIASLGLSRMLRDDLAQLDASMGLYDAFYRWSRDATGETHNWPSPTTGATA